VTRAAELKGAAALSKTTKLQDDVAAPPPLDPLAIQAQAEQNELPQPPAIGDMPDDLKKRMEDIEVIKNGDNIQVGDLGFRVWGFKGYRGDREKGRHSGWWFV